MLYLPLHPPARGQARGDHSGAGAGVPWAGGSPCSLSGSCEAKGGGGSQAVRGHPTTPRHRAGPARECCQNQRQPWGGLGHAWRPHRPPGPFWIQLLTLLLLTPIPVTQYSPSRLLLKSHSCWGAGRKGEGSAWEAFVSRALHVPASGSVCLHPQATTTLPASPHAGQENLKTKHKVSLE